MADKKLGQMLCKARERAGLSLREVTRATGVSYARLCELENEKGANPRVLTIDRLARFYGLDMDLVFRAAVLSAKARTS